MTDPAELAELADRLRALHVPGEPLLLFNVWDAAGARAVAAAGMAAVATTSSGVARALGFDDGQRTPVGEMLAAVKAASPHLVINARVDVHLRAAGAPEHRLALALERAQRYAAAGADCVFPIVLSAEAALRTFAQEAGVPVNVVWTRTSPPPARLAEPGVARVSVGGGMFAMALGHTESLVARLRAGDPTALGDD